jgi:hypothetical protein
MNITACIQSQLERLKQEELLVESQLRVDLGTDKLKRSLMKSRMNQVGLNEQQISYVMQEKLEKEYLDLSPSLQEKAHFSEKFYQILDKLNIAKPSEALGMTTEEISKRISESLLSQCMDASPVQERIQNLNHTLQYLNEENIRLRCRLAEKDAEKPTPTVSELMRQLQQEEHFEHEKQGIMSREYESKIARIKGEDAELFMHMKTRIESLSRRVHLLTGKLNESASHIEALRTKLAAQDDQLNREYLDHGMMIEKANEEVRKLTELLNVNQTKSDQSLKSSQVTAASNPLLPDPPLRLSPNQSMTDSAPPEVLEEIQMLREKMLKYVIGEDQVNITQAPQIWRTHHRTAEITISQTQPAIDPVFDELNYLRSVTEVLDRAIENQKKEIEHDHGLLAKSLISQEIGNNLRQAIEKAAVEEHEEVSELKNDLLKATMVLEVMKQEYVPKSVLEAELKMHHNTISQLTKRINHLDNEVERQARELWEYRTEKGKGQKRIELLTERLQELENEERENEAMTEEKQAEMDALKVLLMVVKSRADETLKHLKAEVKLVDEAKKVLFEKSEEIEKLKDKINFLERIPRGVPEEEVKRHLQLIGELAKRASKAEDKLHEQQARLEILKKEEIEHRAEINNLSHRLKAVIHEEADTKAEVDIRDDKIAAFKKLLAGLNERLSAVGKENKDLRHENKKEMKLLNDALAESSRHLAQIESLTQLVRQMQDDEHSFEAEVNQQEVSKYVEKLSDMRMLLANAENSLLQKAELITKLEVKDEYLDREVISLRGTVEKLQGSQQKLKKENKMKDVQTAQLKKSLDQALTKLAEDHHKLLLDELELDRVKTNAAYLQDECEKRGETIQGLETGVLMLEEVVENEKKVEEACQQKADSKEHAVNLVLQEEEKLKAQVRLLAKKCRDLEAECQAEHQLAQEAQEQYRIFKGLHEECSKRFPSISPRKSSPEREGFDPVLQTEAQQGSGHEFLEKKIKNLEQIPKGIPQEQAEHQVKKILEANQDLQAASKKSKETEEQMMTGMQDEGDVIRLVFMLNEKIRDLEHSADLVSELEKQAHEKEMLRYKAMLLTATERMRDLSKQNADMKIAHKKDQSIVHFHMGQTYSLLQDLKNLTERLESSEASNQAAQEQLKAYQKEIDELTKRLSQMETARKEREESFRKLESQEKQHQDLIVELYKKITEREQSSIEDQALIERQNQQIADLKIKLDESLAARNWSIERANYLERYSEPLSDQIIKLEDENKAYKDRISLMTARILGLMAHQKLLEVRLRSENVGPSSEFEAQGQASDIPRTALKAETGLSATPGHQIAASMALSSESMRPEERSDSYSEGLLKKKIEDLEQELHDLKAIRKTMTDSIADDLNLQNSRLVARIKTLEAALKERDMKPFFEESPIRRLTKQVGALENRIKELEAERDTASGELFAKENEHAAITKLFNELKLQLDEAVALNMAIDAKNLKSKMTQASIPVFKNEQDQLGVMKSRIQNLEAANPDMEAQEYMDKIAAIKDLSHKLVDDEALIQGQAAELSTQRQKADQLLTTVIVLNEKIAAMEREEKHEEEYIMETKDDLLSFKDALKETIAHFKETSDKNAELEDQHKLDQQKLTENIAKMNANLLAIGLLVQNNKYLKAERTEETNRYLAMINQLNNDLIATEMRLKERSQALKLSQEADQEHQAQILRLSDRVIALEEEEFKLVEKDDNLSAELATSKSELQNLLDRLNFNENLKIQLKNILLEDASQIKSFEEDTLNYATILSTLSKKVALMKQEQNEEHLQEINRYLGHMAALSKMLKDTESALIIKTQEMQGEKEVEKMQDKHSKLLFNKIKELEDKKVATDAELDKKNKELEFYKALLKQSSQRYRSFLENTIDPSKHSHEHSKVIKQIEAKIPISIDKEQLAVLEDNICIIRELEHLILKRDEMLIKESKRLRKLRDAKAKHGEEIKLLSNQVKKLNESVVLENLELKVKESKFDDLKEALVDTNKRLQATLTENTELRQLNKQELEEIDTSIEDRRRQLINSSIMKGKINKLEESLKSKSQTHESEVRRLKEQLEDSEVELQAKIIELNQIQLEENQHEEEITKLLSQINDLEEIEQKNCDQLREKLEEVEALKEVLRDTVAHLEQQASSKDQIREKMKKAKDLIVAQTQEDNNKIEEKDIEIKALQDAVDKFSSDAFKLSQDEATARSIIDDLTAKIASMEAESSSDKDQLYKDEEELQMYKAMLVDWKQKLHEQTHINEVFKNKIIEAGQLMAMKASMWPASQFSYLLSQLKKLDELPSMVQNRDIGLSVSEINSLFTDLVLQEDQFVALYHKLARLIKEERFVMSDALSNVINGSSPSSQDNRCFKLSVDESNASAQDLKERATNIDGLENDLNIMSSQILTLLDKISVNLANIALIIESADQGTENKADQSPEFEHFLEIVNILSQKITSISSNFDEFIDENKKRLGKSSHSLLLNDVLSVLEKFQSIDGLKEDTPRPNSSVGKEKHQAILQNLVDQATQILTCIEEEEKAIPRAIQLVGILSHRVIFLEEERRAREKLDIKNKIEILDLLLKASQVMTVHAKTEVLTESEVDELTTATSSLASSFLVDNLVKKTIDFAQQLKNLSQIAKKMASKVSDSLGLSGLIQRVLIDLERLDSINSRHNGILVEDLLEQAIKLNEIHIGCCIDAAQNALPMVSAHDEHLEARAWDAKKIQDLEASLKSVSDLLTQKEDKLRECFHKMNHLTNIIKQLKSESMKAQTSSIDLYNNQITVMRHRINDLESELHRAGSHLPPHVISPESQHHVYVHNDALIRRLHEADSIILALSENNHQQASHIEALTHKLDQLALPGSERIVLEDRIKRLEGELALIRHRSQLTESRLKERVHQLLKSVFVLRLQLLKKHGHSHEGHTFGHQPRHQRSNPPSMVPESESKASDFTQKVKWAPSMHESHLRMAPERQ